MPSSPSDKECTCTVAEPCHHGTMPNNCGPSHYQVYLDFIEDGTEFDPACPFHGEGGSMVAVLRAGAGRDAF